MVSLFVFESYQMITSSVCMFISLIIISNIDSLVKSPKIAIKVSRNTEQGVRGLKRSCISYLTVFIILISRCALL